MASEEESDRWLAVFAVISGVLWIAWGAWIWEMLTVNRWLAIALAFLGGYVLMYLSVWGIARALSLFAPKHAQDA